MMPKPNLLFVITKLELGGAQKQLLTLIRHIDKNRYNCFLFTAREGLLMPDAQAIEELVIEKSRYLERPVNPFKDIIALIGIFRFIKKHKIDIVHTHSSKAGILARLAAKLAKTKIIIHSVHGWSFNPFQSRLEQFIYISLERFVAAFTDKLIVVCEHDKEQGLDNRIGQKDQYSLIRYGIDYNEFTGELNPRDIKESLGIAGDGLVVGMIACLKPQKCPQDFLKVASLVSKIYPSVKFILVGDGCLRQQLEKLINRLGLDNIVYLLGWRRDIAALLAGMDIFILTSLWEGLPIVVLEAMAAAKPVVVTDTGGVTEVVRDQDTGFLVPTHDTNRLSEIVVGLLKDGYLRRIVGTNAARYLDNNFSAARMAPETVSLYDNLITEKLLYN